jgi:quercetin dioxygenase-like cupin family protein
MNTENAAAVKLAEVRELGELLKYQEGAIVSRVLLKNRGGTVTFFAFDAGEGLSEHTAPFDALVLITEGEAEVTIARENFRVRTGETIVLPANRPHALLAITRFKMLLIMVRDELRVNTL